MLIEEQIPSNITPFQSQMSKKTIHYLENKLSLNPQVLQTQLVRFQIIRKRVKIKGKSKTIKDQLPELGTIMKIIQIRKEG
jgi:hypothetical protein